MDKRQKAPIRLLAVILAALLASAALFGALYLWDNKYTQTAVQPQAGVLVLTEAELERNPARYLIAGWELYPGVLLTPQQAEHLAEYADVQYTFIGQYGGMEAGMPARSPHGSATYRLRIELPEEEGDYALFVPEVFSAYRVYVNGRLAGAAGNPDADAYEEAIRDRIVPFSGGGQVELLFAVSDESGIYSGMVYPPAFGYLQEILNLQNSRLMTHMAVVMMAVMGAVLSLYFGLRAGQRKGILACMLCLCLAGITCYPLIHTFFETAYLPWYPVEIGCFYVLLLLAVMLQNSLCGICGRVAVLTVLPCAAGAVVAVCYAAGAAFLNAGALYGFSKLTAVLKYYAAGYLIGASVYAVIKQKRYSPVLLFASLVFAMALLFDRILPLYEPMIGGWFVEIGGAVLIVALVCVLWAELVDAYRFRLSFALEHVQMERRMEMQKEHNRQISEQVEKARMASHDLRHHMRVLREFADQDAWDSVRSYLESYEPHILQTEVETFTSHAAADAVLCYYARAARQAGADYDVVMKLPNDLELPDDALCMLLGNLLENAVEAVIRQQEGRKFIYLRGELTQDKLRLVVDNSFDGAVREEGGLFYSQKRPGLGMGIRSVRALVKHCGGLASFEPEGGLFRVSIMIQMPKKK